MNYSGSAITQALSRTLQFTVNLPGNTEDNKKTYEIFDDFSEHYFKIYIGKIAIEIMNHKIISVINASDSEISVGIKKEITSGNAAKFSLLIFGLTVSSVSISILYSQGTFNFSCKETAEIIAEHITVSKNEKYYAPAIHTDTIASKQLEIDALTADTINANTIKAGAWSLKFNNNTLNISIE